MLPVPCQQCWDDSEARNGCRCLSWIIQGGGLFIMRLKFYSYWFCWVTLSQFPYGEVGPKCCRVAGKLPAQVMADSDILHLWLSASTGCRLRSANVSSWRWCPLNGKSTLYKWSFEANHLVGCNFFSVHSAKYVHLYHMHTLGFILVSRFVSNLFICSLGVHLFNDH